MKWKHPLQGRTIKETMADALESKVGKPFRASELGSNHPIDIRDNGMCSWSSYEHLTGTWNIHSWDTMRDCLKYGFSIGDNNGGVVANDTDWKQK